MKSIRLGLAIHNHQPVGNFPWVFEESYQRSYLPMVEALERHPKIRLALHYSGSLLDWIRQNHPDFVRRVAALASSGQVEIMTGGYYEPILSILKDDDKIGQIEKYSRIIKAEFGYRPTGMWLAERVWEPHFPKPLNEAGVVWTIVDDSHFRLAGISDPEILGYYVSEELGHTLKIYASSKKLRYIIPWSNVPEVIDYLRSQAHECEPRIAVMGDDGEKFGSWPGTYALCWEKGWMDDFFSALEKNADWLHMVHLGQYARQFSSLGRIYLPTASYAEMMEWALPARESEAFSRIYHDMEKCGRQDVTRFMHGGFWRNFLVKYPEINTMAKKMLRVHDKIRDMAPGAAQDEALDFLWKGQTNCPYWHGVFGGVYLMHIRSTVFENLIQAENVCDEAQHVSGPWLATTAQDFDADGRDELLVDSKAMNLYLDLDSGGSLFEWDFRPAKQNLANVLTRRPEAYHQRLWQAAREKLERGQKQAPKQDEGAVTIHEAVRFKEQDLDRFLQYDWYRRACLLDHFPAEETSLESFAATTYHETGDFVNQPYEARVDREGEEIRVTLVRNGQIERDGQGRPFRVQKELRLIDGEPQLRVRYTLTNTGGEAVGGVFGSAWNLNLVGPGDVRQAYYEVEGQPLNDRGLTSSGESSDVIRLKLVNPELELTLAGEVSRKARVWRFPIETVSSSESGFERTYQGSCVVLGWPFTLKPGELWQVDLKWSL
jgi:4-alpha-glucanotransferase